MSIFDKPLIEITAADINQLCADQVAEDSRFEIKRAVLPEDGEASQGASAIGDRARNKIAAEIVAFANTYGGVVVIGIEETDDDPRRAKSKAPIPDCEEMARRLRQAVHGIIDPPLPLFEAAAIVTEDDGHSGVIILRLPKSRRAPHRLTPNKEVYIRREDETVRIDMREIQELTIRSLSEARRIEEEIDTRKRTMAAGFKSWLENGRQNAPTAVAFQILGVPTAPIQFERVAGREDLYPSEFEIRLGANKLLGTWPFSRYLQWRPRLAALAAESDHDDRHTAYSLSTGGICEHNFFMSGSENRPAGLYAGWLIAALARILFWIDRVRNLAGAPEIEYALAFRLIVDGDYVPLAIYGSRNFGDNDDEQLPVGTHDFPLLSVAGRDEFGLLLARFDELLWNLAGRHYPKDPAFFDLSAAPAK